MKTKKIILMLACILFIGAGAKAQTAPNLGSAATFGLLSGNTISSTDTAYISGDAGATNSVSNKMLANTVYSGDTIVTNALADLSTAISFCNSQTGDTISGSLEGQTLPSGVYQIVGNAILNGTLTLTGDTNSVFIFNISDSLIVLSNSYISNGDVRQENIYWNVTKSAVLKSTINFNGIVMTDEQSSTDLFNTGTTALLCISNIIIAVSNSTNGDNVFFSRNILLLSLLQPLTGCTVLPGCNLVNNPGFENYTGNLCTSTANSVNWGIADCWSNPNNAVSAIYTTPDIFNILCNGQYNGIPINVWGNQAAAASAAVSGTNGYGGVISYAPNVPNFREYLQGQLKTPLQAGHCYYFEMYVSKSNASRFSIDHFGAYFYTGALAGLPPNNIAVAPQIEHTVGLIGTGWSVISGTIIGAGQNYFSIGNFRNDLGSGATVTNTNSSHFESYIYVDNVVVTEIGVSAGADVTIVCPQSTPLQATLTGCPGTGYTYSWSPTTGLSNPNTANPVASPGVTTTYTVTVSTLNGACSVTDAVIVTVTGGPTVTVNSPTICAGQTVTLTANGAATYTWAGAIPAGGNTAVAAPTTTTNYTVTGTTNGCSSTAVATVTVNPLPSVTVNSPTTLCPGQTVTLTASGATTYTWSAGATPTGANTADVAPTTTTTYTVTGTTNGCSGTAVATVTVSSPTVTVNSPAICIGATANLAANGATSYVWSAGATSTGVNTATASPTTTTSYTVTGTTGNCSSTTVATVTVNPLPSVAVNSPTICVGGIAILTASGATTYTWSAGATSTGVTTATASPVTTTTYTVTGTTGNCSNTAVATVTIGSGPTVAVNSPPPICPGQSVTLTAVGATSYTWSAGVTSTGVNTATASPATTTSYTITGTTNGCIGTAVETVTVSTTCCFNGTANFNYQSTTDMISQGVSTGTGFTTATNQTFSINGTFTLNDDLMLTNCDVKLGLNAKIVLNGHAMYIDHSHLYGCYMWDGIYGTSNAEILDIGFSLIEDATFGFHSDNGAQYKIYKSVFNKNYVGLNIANYSGTFLTQMSYGTTIFTTRNFSALIAGLQPNAMAAAILGNYNGNGNYSNPIYTLTTTINGGTAVAGVWITDVNLSGGVQLPLGDAYSTSTVSIFDGLGTGIITQTSNVSVFNNLFENMGPVAPPGIPSYGVVASGPGNLIIGGSSGTNFNPSNMFRDGMFGIYANGYNTKITYNTFRNVYHSVNIENCSDLTTDINNNTFTNVRGGIYLQDVKTSAMTTTIYNNTMTIVSATGITPLVDYYGIYYANTNLIPSKCEIYGNTINNPRYGIWLINCSMPYIDNNPPNALSNQINFGYINTAFPYYGIRVQTCYKAQVKNNIVFKPLPAPTGLTNPDLKGISIENSFSNNVVENKLTRMSAGIFASGTSPSMFTCNTNDACWNGFNFNNATIANQGAATISSNNKWQNMPTGVFRYIAGTMAAPSTWYSNIGSNFNVSTGTSNTNTGGFITYPLPVAPNSNCTPPALALPPVDYREMMLGKIVRDEIIYDTLSQEFKLKDSIYAYTVLKDDTTIINLGTAEDVLYQAMWDSLNSSNIGRFQEVIKYVQDTTIADTLAAQITNQNIPTTCPMEVNQRIVNTIYLNKIKNHSDSLGFPKTNIYDSIEIAQLENVAYQNPLQGGDAVYMARVMLRIDVIDDEYTNRHFLIAPQEPIRITDYKIYPNPNNGAMQLSYTLVDNETGFVTITSVLGKKLTHYKLVNGSNQLNIKETELNNGIYFYQVYKNDHKVYSGKIVISK